MGRLDVEQVTEQYFERLHRAALVLTGNPWDADDLAQETFLVMAGKADQFQGRSSPFTWLYGIMLNLERRHRRQCATHRSKLRVLWDNQSPQQRTEQAAETAIEVSQWKRSLWSRVARLPDGQRQALVLRFSEQLSYGDIAQVLECPLGTVKSRIFCGLKALKQMFSASDWDGSYIPEHSLEDLCDAV